MLARVHAREIAWEAFEANEWFEAHRYRGLEMRYVPQEWSAKVYMRICASMVALASVTA